MADSDIFSFCQVCRINHSQKRKHIFTKKHKQRLAMILKKFAAKLKLVEPYRKNPLIQEGEYEPGGEFWCHFCVASVNKHVTDGMKSIIYGGVIEHVASTEHCVATEKFWHANGAELKFKSNFIVPEADFNVYKKKLSEMVDTYESKTGDRTKKVALEIAVHESLRNDDLRSFYHDSTSSLQPRTVYRTVRNEHGVLQNPEGVHDDVRVWKGGIMKYKHGSDQVISSKYCRNIINPKISRTSGKTIYTVNAEGKGLSKVNIDFDNKLGNIHTGATPPWMLDGDDDGVSVTSRKPLPGPSEEEFQKFLKRTEKRKLNPNRVGANFDHMQTTEDNNWLPSFGRVWNDGARWKSRQQYHSECPEVNKKFKKSN